MEVFVIVEMEDVELVGLHLYANRELADAKFDELALAEELQEFTAEDFVWEPATEFDNPAMVRFAGDDAYSIEMHVKTVAGI